MPPESSGVILAEGGAGARGAGGCGFLVVGGDVDGGRLVGVNMQHHRPILAKVLSSSTAGSQVRLAHDVQVDLEGAHMATGLGGWTYSIAQPSQILHLKAPRSRFHIVPRSPLDL